jgi:hypothetical protein
MKTCARMSLATAFSQPRGDFIKRIVAVAIENANKTDPGFVKFFDTNETLSTVTVGARLMRPGFLLKDSRMFPDDPSFANESY